LSDPGCGLEAIKTGLDDVKKSVGDGKKKAAAAIAAKGVPTAADSTFDTLASNIGKIVTLGSGSADATAGAAQILNGYSAYVKGAKVNGSMPNRGAVSHSLAANGSYTIPAGYHNGNGKVTQSLTTQGAQTITPGTADKTIAADRYLTGIQTIKGDANLVPANIAKGKSIFGVSGNFEGGTTVKYDTLATTIVNGINTGRKIVGKSVNLGFKPSVLLIIIAAYNSNTDGTKTATYHSGVVRVNKATGEIMSFAWLNGSVTGASVASQAVSVTDNGFTISDSPYNIHVDNSNNVDAFYLALK